MYRVFSHAPLLPQSRLVCPPQSHLHLLFLLLSLHLAYIYPYDISYLLRLSSGVLRVYIRLLPFPPLSIVPSLLSGPLDAFDPHTVPTEPYIGLADRAMPDL